MISPPNGLSFTMILSHSTYKTCMHLKSMFGLRVRREKKQSKGDGKALMNLIWTFFLEGQGEGFEPSKIPHFLIPPNWGNLEG